jgi:FAD-linked oxidoreductase
VTVSRRGALLAGGAGMAVAALGGGYAVATHDKPEPTAPPETNAQGHRLWRNWSGLQHAYPVVRLAPKTEDELARALILAPTPIRPVGAGHSFTALAPTNGTLVSLEAMSGVLGWEGDEAIVAAGTRLDVLGQALAVRGRALVAPPQDGRATLAGALATGAHGAAARLKALHGDVAGLRLVTPRGEIIDCDATRRAEVFQAARVSLGVLGVITQVRLRTMVNRRLERAVWLEPFEQALAQAEARWARHRDFQLHVAPFTGLAVNIRHDETDAPISPGDADEDAVQLDTLKGLRNLLSVAAPLREAAAQAMLARVRPERSIEEGWKRLSIAPPPTRYNAMTFHLPVGVQLKALAEVVAAIETRCPDVYLPIQCGRTAPDDAWLSPFQGAPTGSITVQADSRDDLAFLYTVVEPIFRRHGGRPHWGQLHSVSGDQLAALYPRWSDFLTVRATLDPEGRMLNPYSRGVFGV